MAIQHALNLQWPYRRRAYLQPRVKPGRDPGPPQCRALCCRRGRCFLSETKSDSCTPACTRRTDLIENTADVFACPTFKGSRLALTSLSCSKPIFFGMLWGKMIIAFVAGNRQVLHTVRGVA